MAYPVWHCTSKGDQQQRGIFLVNCSLTGEHRAYRSLPALLGCKDNVRFDTRCALHMYDAPSGASSSRLEKCFAKSVIFSRPACCRAACHPGLARPSSSQYQVPEVGNAPAPAPSATYVYVSSSESDSDVESEVAVQASGGHVAAHRRGPARPQRRATAHFPAGDRESAETKTQQPDAHYESRGVGGVLNSEDAATDETRSEDSARAELLHGRGLLSSADLAARVLELEEEVKALKEAAGSTSSPLVLV